MTKKLNFAEIIINILMFVLLWIEGTYKLVSRSVYGSYRGGSNCSFIDCTIESRTIDNPIFPIGYIFIILLIVLIALLLIELFDIKKVDPKISAIIPVALLVVFIMASIIVDSKSGGTYTYNGDLRRSHLEMGFLFYVYVTMLLTSVLMNLFRNFAKHKNAKNVDSAKVAVGKEDK